MVHFWNSCKKTFRRFLISQPKILNCLYSLKQLDFGTCIETSTPAIVLFGNSLVRLVNWSKILERDDVINRGISGDSLFDMYERLKYLKAVSVKIAFIEGGINDLPTTELELVFFQYKRIISFWQEKGTIPVVHAVLLIAPNAGKYYAWRVDWLLINQQVKTINKKLREFCLIQKIDFIDLNITLSNSDHILAEFTTDGVHLTPSAYKIWSKAITQVLKQHGL